MPGSAAHCPVHFFSPIYEWTPYHTRNVRSLLPLTIMVSFNFITDSTERVCPLNTREVSFVKSHTRNVSSLLVLTIVVSFNLSPKGPDSCVLPTPWGTVRQIPHSQRTIMTCTDKCGLVQFYHRPDPIRVSCQLPGRVVRQIPHSQRTIQLALTTVVSFNFITDRIVPVCPSKTLEVSFVKFHTRNV